VKPARRGAGIIAGVLLDVHARAPIVHHKCRCVARTENRVSESAVAIRAKNWFWRAAMRREAQQHENFFIAKNRDSESAQRAFDCCRSVAMTSIARRSLNMRMTKTPAEWVLLAILTIAGVAFSGAIRVGAEMHRCVVDERALRVLASTRQRFLKQDSVFFNVLVYSGCSAFRFPSARSD
jgi:hypothetical protein